MLLVCSSATYNVTDVPRHKSYTPPTTHNSRDVPRHTTLHTSHDTQCYTLPTTYTLQTSHDNQVHYCSTFSVNNTTICIYIFVLLTEINYTIVAKHKTQRMAAIKGTLLFKDTLVTVQYVGSSCALYQTVHRNCRCDTALYQTVRCQTGGTTSCNYTASVISLFDMCDMLLF